MQSPSRLGLFLLPLVSAVCWPMSASEPSPLLPPDHAAMVRAATNGSAGAGRVRTRASGSPVTAGDRGWWAFQPLAGVSPPRGPVDCPNPVDAFLAGRLREAGLEFAPEADPRKLVRRLALDVIGLPPEPELVSGFLADTAPDAWDRLVDRMLSDPRHGERWASHWLDVARFAESSGFEHDYDRPGAYHYRDFVIRAFNDDMPYDQFVRWQLAGDEFEPGNPLALMATGFLGAGVFPTQITANEVERTRYDAMDDMLATTGTAMLGLTVGCARCHDHKFDPIPVQDYYRMLATFTTTVRSELELDLDPESNQRARAAHERTHRALVAELEQHDRQPGRERFDAWLRARAPLPGPPTWEVLKPERLVSRAGTTFRPLEDGSFLAEGENGDTDVYTFTATTSLESIRALRVEALAHPGMVGGGPGRAGNGNIGLSRIRAWISPVGGGETNEVPLVHPRATFEQNGNSLSVASALDERRDTGWAVDPQFGRDHAAVFGLGTEAVFKGGTRLTVQLEFELNTKHNIGRPRLSVSPAVAPELKGDGIPSPVMAALGQVQSGVEPDPATRELLLRWWRQQDPGSRELRSRLEESERNAPKPRLTRVLVCAEGYPAVRMHTQGGDFLPETHFLRRGSPDQKVGVATPGFLQVLLREDEDRWRWKPPQGARFSGRRRSLAQWMTDAEHGAGHLLARVIVNRVWQQHFGRGLVTTPNDFGVQGTRPSHPELLDWLAGELIRGGWRLRPIHRLLLTSRAWRQASLLDPSRQRQDPDNALVSRRVPRRLEAEALRDSMLAVSGLLDRRSHGPGSLDPGNPRRSIYLTVKRSQRVPDMVAFDVPEPLVSQGERPVTTVAPQALLLLNGPHVRRWAGALASRVKPSGNEPDEAGVRRAYAVVLGREPETAEASRALAFLAAAGKEPGQREGAWVDLAQVLMSLNEFAYVE